MTEARTEPVPPDPAAARIFLERADAFFADGGRTELNLESRQIIYWQACTSAMEAVLLSSGVRVKAGSGGHILRLTEVHRLLGNRDPDLFERLDLHRDARHDVSYYAGVATESQIEALRAAAAEFLVLARAHVEA